LGLHICYELRLPQAACDEDAMRLLEALRGYVATLGVDRVTELTSLSGAGLSRDHDCWDRWSVPSLLHITTRGIREERDGAVGPISDAERLGAAAFLMHPGRGSEAAVFGLVRPFLSEPDPTAERAEEAGNWFWHYCCKTQYASIVSDEHLVRCHLAVAQTLEEAERLGIGITVRDETHYWETRSTDRLVAEVANMNRIVARFAGAFHDATAPSVRAEGAIFEHPDFERLETEPLRPQSNAALGERRRP
jgi:hypothetical protein